MLEIISSNLNVRQTEKLIKQINLNKSLDSIDNNDEILKSNDKLSSTQEKNDNTDVTFIERILEKRLKLKVSIKELKKDVNDAGNITIFFDDYLDLDLLIKKLIA